MRIECAYKELVELSSIVPHPSNRNKHSQRQIQALAKIIAKVGQRSPIVISTRSMYVVKGHGRLEAIKLLGWDKCAVDYQQYESDLEELNDRIADNEIARYSEFDAFGFVEDLKQLESDLSNIDYEEFGKIDFNTDFLSTNTGQPIDNFDPNKEWNGMPEFEQPDKSFFKHVIVHFKNKESFDDFFEVIGISHTDKTKSIWYPQEEKMDTEQKRYE